MTYRITGAGTGPVEASQPTLEKAARTASKMIDQGVGDVRVIDAHGRQVPVEEWREAQARSEREAARRLPRLGGSDPGATAAPRRRFW